MRTLDTVAVAQQRVLLRQDLNVPLADGQIVNDARLRAALPTLQRLLAAEAAVLLVSHLGRPPAGSYTSAYTTAVLAEYLQQHLRYPVQFAPLACWQQGFAMLPGTVVVAENVRFLVGEETNDLTLAQQMAAHCDVFVMDAFAVAHRCHASTVGVARLVETVVAGPLLMAELQALDAVASSRLLPKVAVVGGAKVATKLPLLKALVQQCQSILLGGALANTFLAAIEAPVGVGSLCEPAMFPVAREVLQAAAAHQCTVYLPVDAVTNAAGAWLDIGPKTLAQYKHLLSSAQLILWNGPMGAFEQPAYAAGSYQLAAAIAAQRQAFTVVGGGDTLAVLDQCGVHDFSWVSTGGAAFLEYLGTGSLPGITVIDHNFSS
jgi:phosphoglycerate kinase